MSGSSNQARIEISKALIGCLGTIVAAIIGGFFLLISNKFISPDESTPPTNPPLSIPTPTQTVDIPTAATASTPLLDKLAELNLSGVEFKQVVLADASGWVVLYDRNGYWYRGIPQPASAKLTELNRAGNEIKQIAFTSDSSWVILHDKNSAWWNGIPQSTIDK